MILTNQINQFRFDGKRSFDDMGLIITDSPNVPIPERDVEFVTIPGRDGSLYIDNQRYKNATVAYKVALLAPKKELAVAIRKVAAWLSGALGYKRLTDTYDPNYYRMAAVSGALSVAQKMAAIGTGTVKFSAKPFRYRLDGEQAVTFQEAGRFYNPEAFEALPKISIFGEGNIILHIGSAAYAFKGVEGRIDLDSELLIAYRDGLPQNDKLAFERFPVLKSGYNDIAFEGNVTAVQIVPRWRTL